MSFTDVVKAVPGLTHYYPLTTTSQAKDVIGSAHGTNHGVAFNAIGAAFNGSAYIELPASQDFSATKTGGLSILVFLTITDWRGKGASEYVHWMGKGAAGTHEWTFRHYVKGGSGEAPVRQGRTSFYAFNAAGGLGAGSYYQDGSFPTAERVFVCTLDRVTTGVYVNGVKRDADLLSGYNIHQTYTTAPVRIGTRDMSTGYLIGQIRRVAFFNRVLTQADITKLYESRAQDDGGSTPTPAPAPKPVPTPTPAPVPVPVAGKVVIGTASLALAGSDLPRAANALVRYTTKSGLVTPTNQYGTEVTVIGGKVTAVLDRSTSAAPAVHIPAAPGYVLSGHGTAAAWLKANAKIGSAVV